MKYKCLALFCLLCVAYSASAQRKKKGHVIQVQEEQVNVQQLREQKRQRWVDSVYNKLTVEERIGQLFMVAAYSGGKNYNEEAITQLINAHQIGGLIFMQGGPIRQADQTNKYQQIAQVPLLIAMDAEWGLGMRLDSVNNFPREMMLGATHDTTLARRVGAGIAAQCKRLGVHIDFAPVVDVNNNPANPVINSRSFGEDKQWVSKLGIAFMKGLQDNGVMACAKHFPGHGNTSVDSHKDLPVVDKTITQLDSLELYPFRQMIKAGVQSMMVAHLEIPALETELHVPTTLSRNTVTGLLKNRMGYKGIVFTDALNMQGIAKYFPPGEAELRAFTAGNDVLLFAQDVPTSIARIKGVLDSGLITQADLEQRVRKILVAKYDAGLANWKPINTFHITEDLNQHINPLREQVASSAITVLRDHNNVIRKMNKNMRIGYVGLNANKRTPLYEELKAEFPLTDAYWLPKGSDVDSVTNILRKINAYDAVIVGVHNVSFYPANSYGLDAQALSFIQQAQSRSNTLIAVMGNAYALQYFCSAPSVLLSYEDDSITETKVARVLAHKIVAKGSLPVTPCMYTGNPDTFRTAIQKPTELKEVITPEVAGVVMPEALYKLNMFIQRSIVGGVFPGCRIIAAKDGKVFYNKSFGYYTYEKDKAVDTNTLYDVASLTKILSTTLAVMRLYEQGKLDLNKTVGDYLPMAKGTDKAGLRVCDLLLHQAGLKSWIPFYKETLDDYENLRTDLYQKIPKANYGIEVTKTLYLRNDYVDTIWNRILTSPLENKGRYVYSDLDYYFLAAIVQQLTGMRIDAYVATQFYQPMGLTHITYNPLKRFDRYTIAPTENDQAFRHQQIQGYVHDPGAAMLGGVAGHAGIFATADDVAAIFQMLLNKGSYKGKQYFKPETVQLFTSYSSKLSRRGLGFDKPSADKDDGGPAGVRATGYAFGHQGFTGTCAWADPATGVVFVFLSNRVFPDADNNKISSQSIRTIAQDYLYEALGMPVNYERQQVYKTQVK